MRNQKLLFFSLSILLVNSLFLSCSKDTDIIADIEDPEITSFSFLKSKNPSLKNDIILDFEDNIFSGRVPINGNISNLIATFDQGNSEIFIDNIKQISGITYNDFSKELNYTAISSDDKEQTHKIIVSYFNDLPIVYINTNGGVPIDSKEEYREGFASIFGGLNYSNLTDSEMKIRGRGHSTWYVHPKKAYQLKFDNQTKMLDMPKDKKWIFLAEHSDKTLIRNKIAFEMGYISNLDWTPQSHFADVFVNDEYNGTYNVCQKVEETNNRVVLGDNGYLLEIDDITHINFDDVTFNTSHFPVINIKEPSLENNSTEYLYIKDLINEFEDVLMSANFSNQTTGYAKYIDVDSFVDWYVINEITKNQDSRSYSSIYLNVIPGEKIKMGPLWDFDLSFGNVNYSDCEFYTGFWVKDNAWFDRLFDDPAFVLKIKERFNYFRNNQDYILDKIDYYSNYISLSQIENEDKWDVIGNYIWPNPVVYNTYLEEVNHLKNWYINRMNWLQSEFDGM